MTNNGHFTRLSASIPTTMRFWPKIFCPFSWQKLIFRRNKKDWCTARYTAPVSRRDAADEVIMQ